MFFEHRRSCTHNAGVESSSPSLSTKSINDFASVNSGFARLVTVPLLSRTAVTARSQEARPAAFSIRGFAENMAAMVLFGLIIALAARSQLKVEKS